MINNSDRNFDDLVARFSARIYGRVKGEIRQTILWHDLQRVLPWLLDRDHVDYKELHVLDIGGGLGQFSLGLAQAGHKVSYNDISVNMMTTTQQQAKDLNLLEHITWFNTPYQNLIDDHFESFDLILCHAVIEWLAQPEKLIAALCKMLQPKGLLSLCFYNPIAKDFRNLIRGNFNVINNKLFKLSDQGSLTPNNPSSLTQIKQWLIESKLTTLSETGIRVFSDYVVNPSGGNLSAKDIIQMELKYSNEEPFKWMGRYLHLIAEKS